MARYTSDFPPFFVTADLVVLSMFAGRFCVLLIERAGAPYAGQLALPGGFVHLDEGLEEAAYRELGEETGVHRGSVVLEQLGTYGDPDRDPRGRVVTVAWIAMGADFGQLRAGTDAAAARWVPVDDVLARQVDLAFDHDRILSDGVERARAKLEYTGYGAALAGETFTISELHAIYEAVWGNRLDRANFQRKVLGTPGFLTETGQHSSGSIGRPARLYRGRANVILTPPFLRE